jgi:hypothetical protein
MMYFIGKVLQVSIYFIGKYLFTTPRPALTPLSRRTQPIDFCSLRRFPILESAKQHIFPWPVLTNLPNWVRCVVSCVFYWCGPTRAPDHICPLGPVARLDTQAWANAFSTQIWDMYTALSLQPPADYAFRNTRVCFQKPLIMPSGIIGGIMHTEKKQNGDQKMMTFRH